MEMVIVVFFSSAWVSAKDSSRLDSRDKNGEGMVTIVEGNKTYEFEYKSDTVDAGNLTTEDGGFGALVIDCDSYRDAVGVDVGIGVATVCCLTKAITPWRTARSTR